MAGGFKKFGPSYNSTPFVRLGYEGTLNGGKDISASLVAANTDPTGLGTAGELAGKFAAMKTDGVGLATLGGKDSVGLFREDMADMVNASLKATFYFRGGEYYVSQSRTAFADILPATIAVGNQITCDATGKMIKYDSTNAAHKALGVVTHIGPYTNGNMYSNAGSVANGGDFIGFILFI